MKLLICVDLIESTAQTILMKELPREVPQLSSSEHVCEVKSGDRMMKDTKCGQSAVALPSNDYPNGQIKKPETLNGASQKSSPIKRIFEVSKSVSFDMTVKKVTIPHQWEKLGLNSEENTELKSIGSTNGIPHESVCEEKKNVGTSKDEAQRTSTEAAALDFVDDSEQFGLSDSEVDKLLADVDDKEKRETSNESDLRKKNGIEHSDNETCNETITTAGDEDMCGNSKESSIVADAVVVKNTQFYNVQSSASACDVDDCYKSKHLKVSQVSEERNDTKSLKIGDTIIDKASGNDSRSAVTSEREMHFKSEGSFRDLGTSSVTLVNAGKMFKHSGSFGVPDNICVKENKQYDTELFRDIESSHSPNAMEQEDESNTVMSSKSDEVSHSHPCNETSEENACDALLRQELEVNMETKDSEGALHDKLVDLEVQSDENQPSNAQMLEDDSLGISEKSSDLQMEINQTELNEKSSDVEMQNDQSELSEKSADVEMEINQTELSEKSAHQTETAVEVGMQNCQNEHVSSGDIEMQDCFIQGSINMHNDTPDSDRKLVGIEVQDQTELKEASSDGVGSNDAGDQVNNAHEDDYYDNNKPGMKPDEAEKSDKLCPMKGGHCEADNIHFVRIRVRESSELKEVPGDSMKTNDRVVGEDNVSKTNASNEENDILSIEKGTSIIEAEHAVDNRGADRSVLKRISEFHSDDGASETKRTRVENCHSENSESDKDSGNIRGKGTDGETDKATRVQRQEANSKAFSENGETVSVVDKECSGVDKGGGERDKEISGVEKELVDKDTSKDCEVVNSSKRVHEPMGLIEVKKVHISPELEKQLKLSEGKNSSAEGTQNEGMEKQEEPGKSALPSELKTNLELAIDRVAKGLAGDSKRIKSSEPPRKLNPMPFMRDLHRNLLKKLSRNELEEFVVQKLCEVVTERCTLGDLRQRCQSLEQMVDQWRKKAQQLQKQVKDMEMVMKRYIGDARTRKERPIPVKITRSVGLQVHMGPLGPGMLRNRILGSDTQRTPGQVRRRGNRVSPPRVAASVQQQQPQQQPQQQQQPLQQPQQQQQQQQQQAQQQPQQLQQQQQRQTQPVVRTPTTNALTVQKVVTPGFTKLTPPPAAPTQPAIARVPIPTLVGPLPASLKMSSSAPKNIVGRPSFSVSTAVVTTTSSMTSTANTVNNTVVNTATNLRVATASQLNNRQQPKTSTPYTPSKPNADLKIIDLTDEEDRAKTTGIMRPVNATPATIATNLIASSSVTTPVSISNNPGIQAGSIRVVQPHQLTGTTATTIIAPSAPTSATSRLAYLVPTSGGTVQQRQVLIASSPSQVRPGVVSVGNRQNQLPTLLFKNGTVVPIQQASGTAPVNTTAILRPGPPVQTSQLQQVLNPTRTGQQIRVAPSLVTTVGRMTAPAIATVNSVIGNKHPAPLPNMPMYQPNHVSWKFAPPKPELKISKVANKHQQGIVLSWNMQLTSEYEEIASYQLYAYQEGSAQPSTTLWKKVGDVKALPLPMACTLTQFMEGHKYHFAVRAVDVHTRVGPFSTPGNIVLTRK